MFRKKVCLLALLTGIVLNACLLSQATTLREIQDIPNIKTSAQDQSNQGMNVLVDKNHWVYKTLEDISKKYNLSNAKFDANQPMSRNEAALVLINLVGKIEQNNLELSDAEKARLDILKQELSNETQELAKKVAAIQTTVDELKGSVSKLEESNDKSWKLDYGKKFKINGGLQAQYTGNLRRGADNYYSRNLNFPYSVLSFSGEIQPHLNYFTSIIPTRGFEDTDINGRKLNSIVEEAYVSTDIIPHHTFTLGQTYLPIGQEGPMSPLAIDTIDKAQIARNFSSAQDIGAKLTGNWDFIDYTVGAYNGNGPNKLDPNSKLDIASWLVFKPLAKYPQLGALELGGGYDVGKTSDFSHNTSGLYAGYKLKKYAIKGEYSFTDGYLQSNAKASGWYIHNTYNLTDKIQLVGRFDQFDPNTKIAKNISNEYTLGANYFLTNNAMLMLNYVYVNNQTKDLRDSQRIGVLTQVSF